MGRAEIGYDREKRLFTIDAGVALGDPSGGPASSLGRWQPVQMIVDTGSNTSALSEADALRMGIALEKLEMKPTGGVTGIASRPYVRDVDIWLLTGELLCVRIPEAMIVETSTRMVETKKGHMVQRGKVSGPSVSIFGMDTVRAIGGRLFLDLKAERGHLEW